MELSLENNTSKHANTLLILNRKKYVESGIVLWLNEACIKEENHPPKIVFSFTLLQLYAVQRTDNELHSWA